MMAGNSNLGFDVNAPGTAVFVIQLIFLILAWLAAAMRAYVKLALLKATTIDDYLMLIALFGYSATAYFTFTAVIDGGLGRPALELDLQSNIISLQSWYANMALSGPISGLFRASIAIFLLRIARFKWHRVILHTIIGVAAITATAYFFIVLLQCSPPSYFWGKISGEANGTCHYVLLVNIATLIFGSLGALSDLILGLLPATILWHVRIGSNTKAGLVAILSFGVVAASALVVRLVFIGETNQSGPRTSVFATLATTITAIVELSLGIIAACIPTLPPLLRKVVAVMPAMKRWRGIKGESVDSLPWQSSVVMRVHRPRGSERMLITPPQVIGKDTEPGKGKGRPIQYSTRAVSSPSNRTISPLQWEFDVERGRPDRHDGGRATTPMSRNSARSNMRVTTGPSEEAVLGPPSWAHSPLLKPLPSTPPMPQRRDRSSSRSRPYTPLSYQALR